MDLEQHFIDLCQILFSSENPDQETIEGVSNELLEMYKNPETLEVLMNLFPQAPDKRTKLFITTGMKNILTNKEMWAYYQENNQSEIIKNLLLQLLQNEQDTHLFDNLVASSEPILKTDFDSWPEYFDLIRANSETEHKFLFSVIMSISMINKMKECDFLENTWDFFTNLSLQGLTSNNIELIKRSSNLVASLFKFAKTIDTNLPDLFSNLIQVFVNQIEQNSPISNSMVQDFQTISEVPDFYLPDTNEYANEFVKIMMNSSLDIDLRCLLLEPLILFLFNDPESDKNEMVSELYDVIFHLSSSSFIEDCCKENQENMLICNSNLDPILDQCEGEVIRKCIYEKGTGSGSSGEIITYGLSLISFATEYPELILHDISLYINFGFECIETDDHPVQETGFDLLQTLFSRSNDAFFGIQDHFFEIAFQAFEIDHPPLLSEVLQCLYQYIDNVTIKKEHVDNLFQSLFQALKEFGDPDIQSQIIDCFTNLVKSLADDISPYSSELFPLIIQAATETDKPEECKLKASAIECLGMLIQYSKEVPDIEQILQLFVDCISSDDYLFISAGFRSLYCVVAAERSEVAEIIPAALHASLTILQSEPTFNDNDEDEDEEENRIIKDVWTFMMDFIIEVAKRIPDSLQECIEDLKEALLKIIEDTYPEEIESMAIKTAASLIRLCSPEETLEFLNKVVTILNDTLTSITASLCFNIIAIFIRKQDEYQIEIGEEIISATCELGLLAMQRELSFQDESKVLEFNVDFGTALYSFFEDVAQSTPQFFPLNDFWKYANHILKDGDEFEQSEIILVLHVVYMKNYETMPNILKKKIIEAFADKLSICDCFNPPYPIGAVRTVVDIEPTQIEKYIDNIMEFIDQLLEVEFEDQLSFNTTMEYAVSLLLSLFSNFFKEKFEVEKYLPAILNLLPATTDHAEASNIYSNLVFLCGEYPEVFGSFSPEIIRIFACTFALKEKDWETIILPTDVLQSMAILLNNLISSMKQGKDILEDSISDELEMQRFQQRFDQYLPTENEG